MTAPKEALNIKRNAQHILEGLRSEALWNYGSLSNIMRKNKILTHIYKNTYCDCAFVCVRAFVCMYSASSQLLPKAANETAGVASVSLYFSNAPTYMYVSTDKYICTFFEHTYAIGEYEE